MKKYVLFLLICCSSLSFAKSNEQKFNDFKGAFTINTVNFDYYSVGFIGSAESNGELIFEIVPEEDLPDRIYQIRFVPDSLELFPTVVSGFYSSPLDKIGILNVRQVRSLAFTDAQWAEILKENPQYVSIRGVLKIEQYGTSVECDSRQYYANAVSFTTEQVYAKVQEHRAMLGC